MLAYANWKVHVNQPNRLIFRHFFITLFCTVQAIYSISPLSQIGWKMAKIPFLSYRRETEKKMSLLKAAMWSVSKVRRLVKIWAKSVEKWPKYHFWAIGVKLRRKCHFWKRLCDQYQKLGGWWKFEPNRLKNGQNTIYEL